jgi:alpha-amylase
MFSLEDENTNALNKESPLYKSIAQIARLRKQNKVLKFGRMQIRPVSTDGAHFHLPECKECLLAFSRILFDDEIIVAYNISPTKFKTEYIQVELNGSKAFGFLYGDSGTLPIHSSEDRQVNYIQLKLRPLQFVVLQRLHE